MTVRHLVLFDIDGTLLDVQGAGRKSFSRALHAAWNIDESLDGFSFAGATDLGVLAKLQMHHPKICMDEVSSFFQALEEALSAELDSQPPRVYPGAMETVSEMANDGNVVMGLVTGNASACAKLKVTHAGFRAEDFRVGAYGDEDADRNVLAQAALQRAEQASGRFDQVTLIGDTPSDIGAALAIGARAVGVSTGSFDADALHAAGADVVLAQLAPHHFLAADSFDKRALS
jgi:phosphoglycolate phosphatase-like HAD superfamily hydrolase